MGYKGDTIYQIIKEKDGRITYSIIIQTIKRMLQEKFNPTNPIKLILDHNYFIDLIKPLVPYLYFEYIKLIQISLTLSKPFSNKKRLTKEEQSSKPVIKSQVLSINPILQSILRHLPFILKRIPFILITLPIPPLLNNPFLFLLISMLYTSPPPLLLVLSI